MACGAKYEQYDAQQQAVESLVKSKLALPGDPAFNQTNNNYETPSFKQICAEFGISSSTDFCFKGYNHDLGFCFHSCDKSWTVGNFKLLS